MSIAQRSIRPSPCGASGGICSANWRCDRNRCSWAFSDGTGKRITKMGITELTVAVWPWLLTMLVFLVIATYWPALSVWLPKAMGMM